MNVCTHTPMQTRMLALSFGRPFSCEAAVYSSQTTALPVTPIICVSAGLFVYACVHIKMCVLLKRHLATQQVRCHTDENSYSI